MRSPLRHATAAVFILLITINFSFAQRRSKPALVCKRPVLAALKPKPELSYPCDEQLSDYDEKTLKLPARLDAIKALMSQLSSFTDPAWWAADIVDLGVCDYSKPGVDQHGAVPWLTYQDRKGRVIYGGKPMGKPPRSHPIAG